MKGIVIYTLVSVTLFVTDLVTSEKNCLNARKQCVADTRCRETLSIFHKVCGMEMVACTTVTPQKCRRVLRTLQDYKFLSECQCGQPHIDSSCYAFRGTIFNHPCDHIIADGDQEQLLVLPTCDAAYKQCMGETSSCFKTYVEYVKHCKLSKDGEYCEADDMNSCHDAWAKIRHAPVFGCICPPVERSDSYDTAGYRSGDRISVIRGYTDQAKDCVKAFNETHLNPCLKSMEHSRAMQIEEAQQTCHHAFASCKQDHGECEPLLSDVMLWCEHSHCEPDRCRSALQNFYARVSIRRRLEVAFCVCRQNDRDGQCLTAMRNLHPTCAQRQTSREEKKCHQIAKDCRNDPRCRERLEEYEKNCSADAVTGKCSVSHRACQFAVTKILGTELHASCVCKGTDFLHQRDCYSWQKLLWSNPCVIESHLALQKEFRKGRDLDSIFTKAPLSTTTPTPTRPPPTHGNGEEPYGQVHRLPGDIMGPQGPYGLNSDGMRAPGGVPPDYPYSRSMNNGGSLVCQPGDRSCRQRGIMIPRIPMNGGIIGHNSGMRGPNGGLMGPRQRIPTMVGPGKQHNPRRHNSPYDRSNGRQPSLGWNKQGSPPIMPTDMEEGWNQNAPPGGTFHSSKYGRPDGGGILPSGGYPPYQKPPRNYQGGYPNNAPPQYMPVDTEVSTEPIIISTPEPRYCILQGPSEGNQMERIRIPEESLKRIYKDSDCSSLCECPRIDVGPEMPPARCHTLGCIRHRSCNTSSAHFPHFSPFYQAYRGECICYYGKFICQRPDPTLYNLGPGIHILLGYSKDEMELLRPYTRSDAIEALKEIEEYLIKNYGFKCTLITKEHLGENIIVLAELKVNEANPSTRQRIEKENCAKPLQDLTMKINARPRLPEIRQDAYLSMFILAELHVNVPEAHTSLRASSLSLRPSYLMVIVSILVILMLSCDKDLSKYHSLRIFADRIGKMQRTVDIGRSL